MGRTSPMNRTKSIMSGTIQSIQDVFTRGIPKPLAESFRPAQLTWSRGERNKGGPRLRR